MSEEQLTKMEPYGITSLQLDVATPSPWLRTVLEKQNQQIYLLTRKVNELVDKVNKLQQLNEAP
jgi:hypothetical protein